MILEKNDKILHDNGVVFLPYVGDNYNNGISFDDKGNLVFGTDEQPGVKTLVLGESHYFDCDDTNYIQNPDLWPFTRGVVRDYLDETQVRGGWKNTFLKFERALFGNETGPDASKKIWSSLAFYNYLQVPMSQARMMGSASDYENAGKPLMKVLEVLKPQCVLVWGYRLYDCLPNDGQEGKFCLEDDDIYTWQYSIGNEKIQVLPLYHPSAGFSWDYWHEIIVKFFLSF